MSEAIQGVVPVQAGHDMNIPEDGAGMPVSWRLPAEPRMHTWQPMLTKVTTPVRKYRFQHLNEALNKFAPYGIPSGNFLVEGISHVASTSFDAFLQSVCFPPDLIDSANNWE
ncbi:MAG: hypothetical protein KDJ63_01985 [Nitratireductor sp.]|nr:hypothetical protein [Nitratireductor sp.]